MWNLKQFLESLIDIVNNCIIKIPNLKVLLHVCDSYNCDYLPHTTFHFYLTYFQLNTDFPFQLRFFTSVTQEL